MVVIVIVVGSSSDIISIRSIGQLWDHEVGTLSSWLISLVVLTITLGDTFKSLAETAGLSGLLCLVNSMLLQFHCWECTPWLDSSLLKHWHQYQVVA